MISQRRDVLAIVVGLLFTVALALGIMILVALPNLRQGSPILTPDGERAVRRAKQQAKEKPLAAAGSTWHGLVALKRLLARLSRRIARGWAPISAMLHEAMDRLEARDVAKRNGSGAEAAAGAKPHGGPVGAPIRHAAGASRATANPRTAAPAAADQTVNPDTDQTVAPDATADHDAAVDHAALVDQDAVADQARAVDPDATADQDAPVDQDVAGDQDAAGDQETVPAPKQARFDVDRVVGRSSVGRPRPVPPISGPIPEIAEDQPDRPANGAGSDPDGRSIDLRGSQRSDADQGAGSARRAH
jgi:hypothetical protein